MFTKSFIVVPSTQRYPVQLSEDEFELRLTYQVVREVRFLGFLVFKTYQAGPFAGVKTRFNELGGWTYPSWAQASDVARDLEKAGP